MYVSLSSLIPSADDLLALEVEEVAGVLLTHLNSGGSSGSGTVQHNKINHHNFFNDLNNHPQYPGQQIEVNSALMEAWSWLQSEGLLVPDESGHSFFFSRRAQKLSTRDAFAAYRKANLLPKGQLHPLIASKVYPAFLRGEYDTAVFQAFREIEICVREAGNFSPDDVGTRLMRDAFKPADPQNQAGNAGPLTDETLPLAEQKAMADLFCGATGLYKNPQSHRYVPTEAKDAAEIIVFASHLLRVVDRRKTSISTS